MHARARSVRKARPVEGGRKAKPARPAARLGKPGRPHRVVKTRSPRLPVPANDTIPLPADPADASAFPGEPDTAAVLPVEEVIIDPEVDREVEETVLAADGDAEAVEAPEAAEESEDAAPASEGGNKRARGDDEPASFLAMYFRDMAELDVLRPEQEFETARNIEQMELGLWRTVVGFAPGTSWILDVVEKEIGKPLHEAG
jgi:hypothetical protein